MKNIPYRYDNLQIPGGGYVTGFAFHPKHKNILYARTDIGGCYRYDFDNDCWISLVEHVTHFDMSETFPLAIALDPDDPAVLYVASGVGHESFGRYPNGYFSVSHDYGETLEVISELPCHVHGNNPGRGTGFRLIVDPSDSNIIWFASQEGGLLKSSDKGKNWESIDVRTSEDVLPEKHMTFIWAAPDSKTLVAASDGLTNSDDKTKRGHTLFISHDGGKLWEELPYPSEREKNDSLKVKGYVPHRYDFDGKYFYVTINSTGPWCYIPSYSCDCGDVTDGRVIRYAVDENYNFSEMTDITPLCPEKDYMSDYVRGGFGGISSSPLLPGYILCSTICSHKGDMIFASKDYGKNWEIILSGLEIGNMHFNAPYMKPEYNGGGSLIHWLTDIKIDPFNPDFAVFNTGTGVFASTDLQSDNRSFSDHCKGIEETVHLNVYAPTKGDIIALDIVGDLGGFVFTELDKPCENSFANENNDRYITSINADYPDELPNVFVATPRGNWTGKSKGGVVYSEDAGKTLKRLNMPFGLSEYIDKLLTAIERPNVNSGWVALSPDAASLVWTIADMAVIPAEAVVYSDNRGESWKRSVINVLPGREPAKYFKPFWDRTENNLVYGFGEDSRLYVSRDGGKTFDEKKRPDNMPVQYLAGIDAQCIVEIRGIAGESGAFVMAMNVDGLWKLKYDSEEDSFSAEKLSSGDDAIYCVGLGIMPGSTDYIHDDKALYVCAIIDKVFGFYRSFDFGKTWEKINNDRQMFGEIKSIDADKKVFGRYFIATGTRGLKYGVEEG